MPSLRGGMVCCLGSRTAWLNEAGIGTLRWKRLSGLGKEKYLELVSSAALDLLLRRGKEGGSWFLSDQAGTE